MDVSFYISGGYIELEKKAYAVEMLKKDSIIKTFILLNGKDKTVVRKEDEKVYIDYNESSESEV